MSSESSWKQEFQKNALELGISVNTSADLYCQFQEQNVEVNLTRICYRLFNVPNKGITLVEIYPPMLGKQATPQICTIPHPEFIRDEAQIRWELDLEDEEPLPTFEEMNEKFSQEYFEIIGNTVSLPVLSMADLGISMSEWLESYEGPCDIDEADEVGTNWDKYCPTHLKDIRVQKALLSYASSNVFKNLYANILSFLLMKKKEGLSEKLFFPLLIL